MLQDLPEIVDHLIDRHRRDPDLLNSREGQQLGCELGAAPARFERGFGKPLEPRILEALGDQLETADHGRKEVVEIVGDAAGQSADRLHLLRLAKRILRALALGDLLLKPGDRSAQISGAILDPELEHLVHVAQRRFGILGIGNVESGADEADMLAGRPPARLRDRLYPAPFAVVAKEARLERERLHRRLAGKRFGDKPLVILGMDLGSPVEIDRILIGNAEELDIGAVDEAAVAIELGHPHQGRRAIGDQAEPLLALAHPLLASARRC